MNVIYCHICHIFFSVKLKYSFLYTYYPINIDDIDDIDDIFGKNRHKIDKKLKLLNA